MSTSGRIRWRKGETAPADTIAMAKTRRKIVRTVTATEFKTRSLSLLREVHQLRETLLITKRGKPVARLVPAGRPPGFIGRLKAMFKVVGDIVEPITPLEDWECLRDDVET
jgi:prevent-host-death family protein